MSLKVGGALAAGFRISGRTGWGPAVCAGLLGVLMGLWLPDACRGQTPVEFDPFAGQVELPLEVLVGEVLARNPSLQAAVAAWKAAAARYPQAVSLDDPMVQYMQGLRDGWMVEAGQKIPWPGKRELRGQMARAMADRACHEVGEVRLRLTEAAQMAFYDYYLAQRALEVNADNTAAMQAFRQIAQTRYESAQVSQQDLLQANVELAELEGRQAEVERERAVAVAQINTLLHRPADLPLPSPPTRLEVAESLPPREVLCDMALTQRPELAAEAAQIRAEEAAWGIACKEYLPDVELAAKYDHFMPEEMRTQLGVSLNVPLRVGRRDAAQREAACRLQQRRAEYQTRRDAIALEVQSAYLRLNEAHRLAGLYQNKILPAAQENLQSAQANYVAGKVDFLRLIDAQRQVYRQQDRVHETTANYHRRWAELMRAVGGSMPVANQR